MAYKVPRKRRDAPYTIEFFQERSIADERGCWVWQLALGPGGYGTIRYQGGNIAAHRLAYMVATGTPRPPRHIDICHRCDVRPCVNPAHLFAGTRKENMADCIRKGRFSPVPVLSGDASPNSKLTSAQVALIRSDGRPGRALARAYGVDKGTIASIRKGLTWRVAS